MGWNELFGRQTRAFVCSTAAKTRARQSTCMCEPSDGDLLWSVGNFRAATRNRHRTKQIRIQTITGRRGRDIYTPFHFFFFSRRNTWYGRTQHAFHIGTTTKVLVGDSHWFRTRRIKHNEDETVAALSGRTNHVVLEVIQQKRLPGVLCPVSNWKSPIPLHSFPKWRVVFKPMIFPPYPPESFF